MSFWFLLSYLVVISSFFFILVCVDPNGTGCLSKLSRFFYYTIPDQLRNIGTRLLGADRIEKLAYYGMYVFRKPNPVFQILYLSLSLGGYTIFALEGFPMLPCIYADRYHIYIGTALYMFAIYSYIAACSNSPGLVNRQNLEKFTKLYPHDNKLYFPNECRTCKQLKVARSKHCQICNACVLRQDHHCIWINACVGHYNYKYFVMFIGSHTLICGYAAVIAFLILVSYVEENKLLEATFRTKAGGKFKATHWMVFQYLLQEQTAFIFVFVLCTVISLVLFGFFVYHAWLISGNQTSNERFKRLDKERDLLDKPEELEGYKLNLYDKGWVQNWKEVFSPA